MKEFELLTEVARLYYEQNMTQMDIAKRLYISRSSVSRLLKQARDEGIVEITIHYPYDRMRRVEYEFSSRFNLKEIRIVDSRDRTPNSIFTAVTKLAASYINSLLNEETVLGLTWGKSVCGMTRELRPTGYLPDMQVVQMTGSIESNTPEVDGPDLIRYVADLYGCKYQSIMLPFTVEDKKVRDSLIKRPSIIEGLSVAEYATIMCTGIGSKSQWDKYIRQEELEDFKKTGAIGFIAGYYYDINGHIIDLPQFYDRMICASKNIFTKVPNRVAIVADPGKSLAVLGALRGGLINSLVTNTKSAAMIISLDDKYKKKK